jgi:hypothetical protein
MKLTETIRCVFDDALAGKTEAALLHACNSIDFTAKLLYPSEISGGKRFVRCIREYYWLVEPMMGVGLNLVDTRFDNIHIPKLKVPPDFADIVYSIHRCSHAHGNEVAPEYELLPTHGPYGAEWRMRAGSLQIPDRVIWALTSVAVFCRENRRHHGWGETRELTWAEEKFPIANWWGREQDIKPLASRWNTARVKINTHTFPEGPDIREEGEYLVILAPTPDSPNVT